MKRRESAIRTSYHSQSIPFHATENLKTIKRFTRASANYLNREIALLDPATWTRPWT